MGAGGHGPAGEVAPAHDREQRRRVGALGIPCQGDLEEGPFQEVGRHQEGGEGRGGARHGTARGLKRLHRGPA
jgi:hypothetical protein